MMKYSTYIPYKLFRHRYANRYISKLRPIKYANFHTKKRSRNMLPYLTVPNMHLYIYLSIF